MTTRIRKVITAIDAAGKAFSEVHSETQVGDNWYPNDPVSLEDAGPEAAAWVELYGATQAAQITALTAERDSLAAEVDRLTALVPPPNIDDNGVPLSITRTQAQLMLLRSDMLDAVESVVAASGREAQIWYTANEWLRNSPTLLGVADKLGLTAEQIDGLFFEAGKIVT